MTLGDIQTIVGKKLSDTSFDPVLITASANWFINELFTNNLIRFMEKSATLSASTGDTRIPFPADFQTIIKEGLYLLTPQVWNLSRFFVEYGDFMRRWPGYLSYTATLPYQWTDFNNGMRLAAPLSANVTINCDYVRRPVPMALTTDVCELPDVYQELVILGTLARCMDVNEDYGEAQSELNNLAPLITAFIASESRGNIKTGPTIMRTNRRRNGILGSSGGGASWSAADF